MSKCLTTLTTKTSYITPKVGKKHPVVPDVRTIRKWLISTTV